jgi:cell filamentation protein, protein adenylyltransferase
LITGVVQTAREATETAERLFELRESHRSLILDNNLGQNGLLLLSHLFQRPLVNISLVASMLGTTFPTASRLVAGFEELGLLREITGQKRSRVFRYEPYLALFDDTIDDAEASDGQTELTEPAVADHRA